MKNKINLIIIISFIIVLCISLSSLASNNQNISQNEEFEYVISFDDTVITADFSIVFDTEKLTYIGSSTNNLNTNLKSENSEILACYYDLSKIGTKDIVLKFKANNITGNTKIDVKYITIHTQDQEKQIKDLTSKNIKIINAIDNSENNNLIQNNTTDQNDIGSISNENTNQKNQSEDNTKKIGALPYTGPEFNYIYLIISIIIIALLVTIFVNKKLNKKTKIILSILIIFINILILACKFVFAFTDNKIFINKDTKTILVVLTTENESRSINVKDFKEKTKAISIKKDNIELTDNDLLKSEEIVNFSNNQNYSIQLYRDENNNGYINSGDIFELLNKENIDKLSIEELCDFIIKKEEFSNYTKEGFEEFNDKSISIPSTPLTPAQDLYSPVNNLEELKNTDAKVGDKYKTLGYYEANDGGAGRYDIIEMNSNIKIDNGLYIKLNNGLIAQLLVKNNTVNVKQFGAKGDTKNDDTKYLNTALNSGIATIELPKGEYKITDIINMSTQFTNVIGNDSTIFTDNDYNPQKTSEFLFIMNTDNCSISNLKIEARETNNIENLYKAQVYVGATNIQITNCSFKIPETTSNERSYSNIDLYTGWHNVLIENCDLYLANDAKEGGCIWIRDLFNRGASDLTFKNNRCYKKSHDEILAIFMGTIENVNILKNTFVMADSTDPSTMAFTLGSSSSKKLENVKFEENTIDVKTTMDLLVSRNAKNLSIKGNKMKFERVTTLTNTFVMYFPENNLKDITIENNELEIYNNTEKTINGIISSNSENILFTNNRITANCEIAEAFSGNFSNTDNTMLFNKPVTILANKPSLFKGNNVIFNEGIGAIFQYYKGGMSNDSNIIDNTFENKYDEESANGKSILLMFNGGSLENHIVNFENNIIKSEKANKKRNLIYSLDLSDENPQTIYIKNNKIDGYKSAWRNSEQDKHNVYMEKNYINGILE